MSRRIAAVGWSLFFVAGGLALSLYLLRLVAASTRLAASGGALPLAALQSVSLLLVFGALSWLIGGKALGLKAQDFGVIPVSRGVRGFGRGFVLGLLLAALAMAVAVPVGHAAWRGDGGGIGAWVATLGATALVLLPAALAEELVFRGVPLVALSRAFGRRPSLVVLAALFGLGHLFNPGITALGVTNIALAGLFLGFAFFTPGGLWTSTGAHLGWNLTVAGLAAPVSGLPLPMPWIDYVPGGPNWLTGGSFGPEGGILAYLCLAAGAVLVARRIPQEILP